MEQDIDSRCFEPGITTNRVFHSINFHLAFTYAGLSTTLELLWLQFFPDRRIITVGFATPFLLMTLDWDFCDLCDLLDF